MSLPIEAVAATRRAPSGGLQGLRRGWIAGGALVLLAACGGGGGGAGPAAPDPLLGAATAYGSSSTELPAGARLLALDDFRAWAAGQSLAWVAPTDAAAALQAARQRQAEDKALVDGAIATRPALARHVQLPAPTDPAYTVNADGTRLWTNPRNPAQRIVLNGPNEAYADLAASLRRTNARDNVEAVYRALFELLPQDRRDGLPAADALAALSDPDLITARNRLVRRVETYQPAEDTPALPWPAEAATQGAGRAKALAGPRAPGGASALDAFGDITACGERAPPNRSILGNWSGRYGWSLKGHGTPVRNQGNRGACVAFGSIAGIETWVSRWRSRLTDLSEQELYAQAKYGWWPSANYFGDGLPTVDTVLRMTQTGWRVDNESAWPYNASDDRVQNNSVQKYFFSCQGYTGPCSETNHQRPLTCTTAGGNLYCAYPLPPSVSQPGSDNQRLTLSASLWDPFAPEDSLAAVRAMLAAGKPVVLSIDVDTMFQLAGDLELSADHPGVVSYNTNAEIVGGHAIVAVGYIPRSALSSGDAALSSSSGYLVLKNSWGCAADRGHYYVPYDWAIDNVQGAVAVLGVASTVTAPAFTLSVSSATVTNMNALAFTVQGNVARRKVRFYRAGDPTPIHVWNANGSLPPGSAPLNIAYTAMPDAPELAQGVNWVIARVEDEGGTPLATNWVKFVKDTLAPTVSLNASADTVLAGSAVTLTAAASDASGINKVEFFRGLQKIGERPSAPYTFDYTFPVFDLGASYFTAIATDGNGHKRLATPIVVTSVGLLKPVIGSFTATPDALAAGGGTATLAWSVVGAAGVSIEPGLGTRPASGSVQAPVTTSTVFTLSASNAAGTSTRQVAVTVTPVLPPTIQGFTATPTTLPFGGGPVALAWNVIGSSPTLTLSPGVGDVTGLSGKTVAVTQDTTFTLSATNAGGARTQQVTVTVAPAPADTTPPVVTLASSTTGVAAPGNVTLTATATDNAAVARVDFFEGATLLATRTAAPYTLDIAYTAAQAGSHSYTARATDTAGLTASAGTTVTVTAVPSADRHVDPVAGSDGNDGQSSGTPYKTLGKALANVGSAGTVWLADGSYTHTAEGLVNRNTALTVPAGITVRGRNPVGGAVLGFGLRYAAGGGAIDLAFAGASLGDAMSGIVASGGTLTMARLRFTQLGSPTSGGGGRNGSAALKLGGSTVATLDMAGADVLFGAGVAQAVLVTETATLAVSGGRIDQPADCHTACTSQMTLLDSAQLSFDGLQAPNLARHASQLLPAPVVQASGAATLTLRNSTLAMPVTAAGFPRTLVQLDNTATARLIDTTVGALFGNVVFARSGTPRIEIDGLVSSNSVTAYVVGSLAAAQPVVVVRRTSLTGFTDSDAVVQLGGGGGLELRDSTLTGNRLAVHLQGGTHQVLMRGNDFSGSGTCGRPGCAGVRLDGAAASVYDLGTLASPGGNRFGAAAVSTGLALNAAGATASAVGNVWLAHTQGSDAQGRFNLGTAPCGDSLCPVTGGSGSNYHVGAGTLRLAGP